MPRRGTTGATALYILKSYQKAVESYEQALSIDAGNAGAWHNRGNALARLEQYQKAVESYDMARRAAAGERLHLVQSGQCPLHDEARPRRRGQLR